MTTYSDSAIESAARAVFDEINEWYPLEGVPNLADHAKTLATAALTAAAPYIQAAALRDAAGHLMVNMTEPSGEAYRILHERANSIEGKES